MAAATTGHGGQTSGDNANEEGAATAVELKAEGGLLQEAGACRGRGVEDGRHHAAVVVVRRRLAANADEYFIQQYNKRTLSVSGRD